MTTRWVDFALIKEQASFSAVLGRYGIKHRSSGGQISVLCPFHDDRQPSLSVDFERKLFHCFSCEAKGDLLTFVAKMEQVSITEAARTVAGWCGIPVSGEKLSQGRLRTAGARHAGLGSSGDKATCGPLRDVERGNRPLGFTLNLDPTHPYLSGRGLTPELIETFGVGYCGSGFLRGRIAVPLHDESGTLVGYAGRWASDEVPDGTQKYLLPRGFKKSRVLFNYHRVADVKHLVVVEGYWSVFRLHALEAPAVALMGRTLSKDQEELLVNSGIRLLTLLLDGDEPGRKATEELLPRLSRKFFVRVPPLPEGEAPDTVREDILIDAVRLRQRTRWIAV